MTRFLRQQLTLCTAPLFLLTSLYGQNCSSSNGVTTCSTTTGATVTTTQSNDGAIVKANNYPVSIAVSGATGTISKVALTVTGLSAGTDDNIMLLLVSPSSSVMTLVDGYGNGGAQASANVTFSDTGTPICDTVTTNYTCSPQQFSNGSFQPVGLKSFDPQRADYPFPSFTLPNGDTFSGVPGLSQFPGYSGTGSNEGSGTLASAFNGQGANGTWSLYLANGDFNLGTTAFTSWSISITTVSAPGTTTTMTSADTTNTSLASNTSFVGDSVTFTASVTSTSTVNSGAVTFSIDGVSQAPVNVATSGNNVGKATFTTTSLAEGSHSIIATYNVGNVDASFAESTSSTLTQTVNNHTTTSNITTTGGTFCNTGSITIPAENTGNAISAPYPSHVYVGTSADPGSSNLTGTLTSTSIDLKKLSLSEYPDGLEMLLVSPGGKAYEFLSNAGLHSGTDAPSNVNITLADSASGYISNSSNLSTGTYKPTVYGNSANNDDPDVFISPAPQTGLLYAGPATLTGITTGNTTLGEAFNGGNATGAWTLYVNNAYPGSGALSGGWCIDLAVLPSATPTTTSLTSSAGGNDQFTDQSVMFTATVTSGTNAVTTGTVTFTDTFYNTATSQNTTTTLSTNVSLNASGQATYSAPAGTFTVQGIHTITATYSGFSGTTSYGTSFQTLSEQVDSHTVVSGNRYCNPGTLTIQGLVASPYPMHVFVGGLDPNSTPLAGTVKTVSVSMNGITVSPEGPSDLKSLLTGPSESCCSGPGSTVFDALDFFSHTGNNTAVSGVNLTFSDTASSQAGSGALTSGSYKPSSYTTTNTYSSPAPAGPYQYAAPEGTSTFTSVFTGNSQMPNGAWSFYFSGSEPADSATIGNSVCVTLTTNPPAWGITSSHSGSFTQSGTATYTITVSNPSGPGSTAGAVTVTEIPPSGMTLTSLSGTGWTCATLPTCTRSDQLSSETSYPAITATLSISPTATTGTNALTNEASVTGGGASNSPTAMDPTTITAAASLSLAKTHTGTLKQGSTGTYVITVHNAAGTTSGTTTVSDSLPTGYTIADFGATSATWTCSGIGTQAASCTSVQAITAGSGFPVIDIDVNVPANSALTVTNTASVYGGGDSVHTSLATAASGSDSNASVTQTASTITATAGASQSAGISTQFTTQLQATVKDAGSNPVQGVAVTFTAPAGGAGGTFADSHTNVTIAVTNASGIATAAAFTANTTAGPYSVTASAPGVSSNATFSLTNVGIPATVTNIESTTANGSYTTGASIAITVTFNKAVNVTGAPQLALNSGGTAGYSSGSGNSILTFVYVVGAGQNSTRLDASSNGALGLNGGTIQDPSTTAANLSLPTPGAAGSLGANTNIVIDTIAPAVVSYSVQWGAQTYNLAGSQRNRLPWQITGIQVVFSKPIATANAASLSGVSAGGVTGLGTNTLTWSVSPLSQGAFSTVVAGTGANAVRDTAGNVLSGGSGFSQTLKILEGDFNDDGVVSAADGVLVNSAISGSYNIFADMNGDGVVNSTDVQIVRTRIGTSLP